MKVKLNKWYIFLAQWLNFWNWIGSVVKSGWFHSLVLVFVIVFAVICGFVYHDQIIKSQIKQQMYLEQVEKLKNQSKVEEIMASYNCYDYRIRDTILQSKYPILLSLLLGQESNYVINAISKKNCKGLGQISRYHIKPGQNVFDPITNIKIADRLLSEYMEYFKDDPDCIALVLASYNAGFPLVKKLGKVPNYEETKQYVINIETKYKNYNTIE